MTDDQTNRPAEPRDAVPRTTPFELAFASMVWESRTFPAILDEAEARGVDPAHRERFEFLTIASDALREVVPPDAPPGALEDYRVLLFHAFNFWRFGKRLFYLEQPVARYLIEAAPSLRDWDVTLPYPSLYVQLPANLFWASITPDATPEPVDGIFATAADGTDPLGIPFQQLEVLLVLGIRRDRAGFSVIPVATEVGEGIAVEWAEAAGRETGADFENVLPGGELSGLYSILTTAEVLKLTGRTLWYIDAHPGDIATEDPPAERTGDDPSLGRDSRLPFQRVRFGGAE